MCKKCLTMHVDNWDPSTYQWILEEVDVPYIKEKWDSLLQQFLEKKKPEQLTGTSILGKYISTMKLKQYSQYRWRDTEMLAAQTREKNISAMRAQGMSGEEIEQQLNTDHTPGKPHLKQQAVGTPEYYDPEQQQDEFSTQLTDEDRVYLRLKWGRGYPPEDWIRLEKLYSDMEKSYDIQDAGMKDSLILICKASLRANQAIDAGDIEIFQKATKVYNDLMKASKLTAAQNKNESNSVVDSIGELVTLCEKEKFIPRFYVDSPRDKIDQVIKDLQGYTRDLVTEELGLGNLIENSLKQMEREKERIADAAKDGVDDDELLDEEQVLTDQDFKEFFDLKNGDSEGEDDYIEP